MTYKFTDLAKWTGFDMKLELLMRWDRLNDTMLFL